MSMRLKGKTALVTAAAQGIGRATALAFAAEGAQVYATDLNAAKLAEIVGPGIRTMALDVRDTAAVQAAAEVIGGVDILFNCAGFVHQGSALEATEAEWDFAFDLNVKSMLRTTQAFLPGMLAKGGGSVINMASVASSVTLYSSARSKGLPATLWATSQVSTRLIGHSSSSGVSIQSRISPNSERCPDWKIFTDGRRW